MASLARGIWDSVGAACLNEIEAQCASCSPATSPNPILLDENLRAYVMLLGGHFQAYCRDLYSECAQALVNAVPATFQYAIQVQCDARRDLEKGNPRTEVLKNDFGRFGLDLGKQLALDPANARRLTDLDLLNKCRNYAAHRDRTPPTTGTLNLAAVQSWKNACGELIAELERIMYSHMGGILGRSPW